MSTTKRILAALCCTTFPYAALSQGACTAQVDEAPAEEVQALTAGPNGKGGGTKVAPPAEIAASGTSGNGIDYHGGPVMTGTTHVYYIWYGNWSGNSATSILTDLASHIGDSPYFKINTTYYNGAGTHVSSAVTFGGSTTDSYSQGTALSDAQIYTVVSSAISSHRLPADANGVYFVLTSADVSETSGFCSIYCGWHTHGTVAGTDIKYAFVGNSARCLSACAPQPVGPNGNAGADGMASVIAHELDESVTDPDLNAWYSGLGEENADLCAWTFGAEYTAANGAKANMKLGTRDFLIQQNWVNAGGGSCALSYPSKCTPGDVESCCAYSQGCTCLGDRTCKADGTWGGGCQGSTPKGVPCP